MTALGASAWARGNADATTSAAARKARSRAATALVPRTQPALERRRQWERRYTWRLRLTDTAIVVAVPLVTAIIDKSASGIAIFRLEALSVSVLMLMLWLGRTRSPRIMGEGSAEYKRVAHSTGFAFGILAMLFVLFQWQGLRFQLIAALPASLVLLVASRWGWRKWLTRQRRYGHYSPRAIVTGTRAEIEYVLRTLQSNRAGAFTVAGVAPSEPVDDTAVVVQGISYEVLDAERSVAAHARTLEADSVIVAGGGHPDPGYLRRLTWELEGTAAELILSSHIVDVAGPRVSLRPVEGLPLVHVELPHFEGGKHNLKRAMDILLGLVFLIPVALAYPVIALAIKLDSRGPVFFRQTRIGRDGREFEMVKFRTMGTDAEARLAELQAANEGNGLLFKMKNDPRVTRVGAILRKFSLDELPQFWNVLKGDMSIVGPRPPLPREASEYDGTVTRRLFIKPGITGPWQVGGRSDLSWEDSVRLDLRYVENWSVTDDLRIMWRTAAVMAGQKGAY